MPKQSWIVIAGLVLLGSATRAIAQDKIELYTDLARTQCSLAELASPEQVYVYLTGPIPATGVRFSVPKPACWPGATWVGDTLSPAHVAIGNSQTDWSVGFFAGITGCPPQRTPPIYIGSISYFVVGQAVPCCKVTAQSGLQFVFTDCTFNELPLVAGQSVYVNANETCPCQSPIATEPATWGGVKSLYR